MMRLSFIVGIVCTLCCREQKGDVSVFVSSLSMESPAKARPVVVGTSPFCNILFGKLQRAASLWGTNLGQPMTIVDETLGDSGSALEKCLWGQFGMSNSGADGKLDVEDLLLPLNVYTPNTNIKDALLFFDATTARKRSSPNIADQLFSNFFKSKKDEANDTQETTTIIDPRILDCSEQRGSAHWYILASHSTLDPCQDILKQYSIPSTIVCVDPPETVVKPKNGWVSSRSQNMEGEFQNPMKLDSTPAKTSIASLSEFLYSEDVAELMLQVSLRAERKFTKKDSENNEESPLTRVVFVRPSSEELLVEQSNADYFTLTGGRKAKEAAGMVRTVSNWQSFLSPLGGPINDQLAKRPKPQ